VDAEDEDVGNGGAVMLDEKRDAEVPTNSLSTNSCGAGNAGVQSTPRRRPPKVTDIQRIWDDERAAQDDPGWHGYRDAHLLYCDEIEDGSGGEAEQDERLKERSGWGDERADG
jgi:hypothetical protein